MEYDQDQRENYQLAHIVAATLTLCAGSQKLVDGKLNPMNPKINCES